MFSSLKLLYSFVLAAFAHILGCSFLYPFSLSVTHTHHFQLRAKVGPTRPLHCGYHLSTGGVEALNDACHSVWGIAVKTSATLARAAIWQTVSRQPRYRI